MKCSLLGMLKTYRVLSSIITTRSLVHFSTDIKKTPLYDFHVKNGGKMVQFCGFSLPIQYESQNIIDSHNFVRNSCGLFDVSHMLQTVFWGSDANEFIESLTTVDVSKLASGSGSLSVCLNEAGGIMDDLIVNNCSEGYLYIVSNAGCAEKITKHFVTSAEAFKQMKKEIQFNFPECALLAVQGPKAYEVIRKGIAHTDLPAFDQLYFMETKQLSSLFGLNAQHEQSIRITRCGYTGEDGFEISVPKPLASQLASTIIQDDRVKPIGLAARDTLRLESGMCLYGNDISEDTTPVEASLSWLIGKRRRSPSTNPRFPGYDLIMNQLANPSELPKRRIGIIGASGPQARPGSKIYCTSTKHPVGEVTSGCMSPTLGRNIAMAYVKPDYSTPGTELMVNVRKKFYPFNVITLPFVPNRYVRRPKV